MDLLRKGWLIFLAAGLPMSLMGKEYSIADFGAKAGSEFLNTRAIQAAIDAAAKDGGGKVVVPAGTFLTGSIILKSNIELHLSKEAVLLGSLEYGDYQRTRRWLALVLADQAENISITGQGTLDGRGGLLANRIDQWVKEGVIQDPNYSTYRKRPSEGKRPQLVEFLGCKKILIRGITFKDAASWVQTYQDCSDLLIEGIRVESTAFWNNDGIDLVDCRDAVVRDCFVNSADHGICLKSEDAALGCDRILIERCTVRSSASAVKFGTASHGGFSHITVRNITVYDTYRSAIAIESVDGGTIDDIEVSDITAKNTGNAIFLRVGQRNTKVPPGALRNVRIRNVRVEVPNAVPDAGYPIAGPPVNAPHNLIPSSIAGLPDRRIENVRIEDMEIVFGGGGKKETAFIDLDALDRVPEQRDRYPEFSMFGELPACGFYVRHASGLSMKNITVRVLESDHRPAFVFDDVCELALDGVRIGPGNPDPQIILNNVHQAGIRNVPVPTGLSELIRVQGGSSGIP